MQTNTNLKDFPRVEVPGTTDEQREQMAEIREQIAWSERMQSGFLRALFIQTRGKPFTGVRKPAAKPTKHQRRIASAKARSGYLKAVA